MGLESDIILRIRAIAEMGDAQAAQVEIQKLAGQVDTLQEAAGKASNSSGGLPAATKGTRDLGMAAMQTGMMVDDMQYGLRGIVNNIPMLVTSLGGSLGLAGAIGIAAVALNQLVMWLGKTKDETTDAAEATAGLADKIREVAENAAANTQDELDRQREANELALERQEILARPNTKTDAARAEAETQSLANAQALIEASYTLAEVMGRQVNQLERIAAIQEVQEAARQAQARQAMAAEEAKVAAARATVEQQKEKLNLESKGAENAAVKVESMRQELDLLRQQRDEMKKLAAVSPGSEVVGNIMARSYGVDTGPVYGVADKQAEAEQKLPEIEAKIATIEANILVYERAFDAATSAMAKQDNALTAAEKAAEDAAGAAETKIESLGQTLKMESFTAKTESVVEEQKALSDKAKEYLSIVETDGKELNASQKKAKDDLQQILADGKVAVEEQTRLYSAQQTLMNATKGSFDKLHSLAESSNKLMSDIATKVDNLRRDHEAVKARVASLSNQPF